MEVLPVMVDIYDMHVVSIKYEQVAFITEDNEGQHYLLLYKWVGRTWKCEVPFKLVNQMKIA